MLADGTPLDAWTARVVRPPAQPPARLTAVPQPHSSGQTQHRTEHHPATPPDSTHHPQAAATSGRPGHLTTARPSSEAPTVNQPWRMQDSRLGAQEQRGPAATRRAPPCTAACVCVVSVCAGVPAARLWCPAVVLGYTVALPAALFLPSDSCLRMLAQKRARTGVVG